MYKFCHFISLCFFFIIIIIIGNTPPFGSKGFLGKTPPSSQELKRISPRSNLILTVDDLKLERFQLSYNTNVCT